MFFDPDFKGYDKLPNNVKTTYDFYKKRKLDVIREVKLKNILDSNG